ncbi:inter-alpha-trypsin inhibitor heavy chain H6 isoform X2 [Bicyclus anynana]|uniref:Inter-alpha-trypsin inhibitor heavy chain H6 isoform X2 n=1 Tax=Bicyclus anynana TaxID=110368 RepID=A0ABM3M7G1_BICAN|nr:inter-alpha-trypsin inhibitor heavy chain H6 isoform X2 [Bicyclus anynana]
MKSVSLGTVLCILVLGVHSASLDFPRFPTRDGYRVIVGHTNPIGDDVTDDDPVVPIKMTHMRVRSEIALRYARTAVICKVYNPNKRPQEASFNVLLPETAFISGFTMTIGKENYEAYVKEKEDAKKIYQDAVAQGNSAAHVDAKARDSNHFTIKYNVEGNCNATYVLRYEELLGRQRGVYNHVINLLPGAFVPNMDVVVHIKESQRITELRVPELRTGNEIDATEKDPQNLKAVIRRGANVREATITFTPDLVEQKRLAEIYAEKSKQSADPDSDDIGYDSQEEEDVNKKDGLLGQFAVQYDVDQPKNGEILVNDGYFVHFFAPSSLPPLSKHVVFVLDTSISMAGNKIAQLITAIKAILSDLNPKDYFNIIEFNTYVTVHDLKMVDNNHNNNKEVPPALASPDNIAAAKSIVSRFTATGATNIYEALDEAIKIVKMGVQSPNKTESTNDTISESRENDVEPIIIFLTDGEPTAGDIIDTDTITNYISEKNTGDKQAPLFSLAFGDDADRPFLRKLSLRNDGFMRQIYEAADAALQLRQFYERVSSPILSNVKFVYPRRQIKEGSLSRSQFRTINKGSEVAVVGRISENAKEITPQVYGIRSDGEGRRIRYEVNPTVPVNCAKDQFLPLERLWAYLTIKQLLDKRDADDDDVSDDVGTEDSPDSPKQRALAIALKYSFVTPLTSLVVVRLNKTNAEDLLDAESVDDVISKQQLFPVEVRSGSDLTSRTYTAFSSGTGLSLTSNDGPVLFAQSTKRFTSYGGSAGGDSSGGLNTHIMSRFPDDENTVQESHRLFTSKHRSVY